MSVTGSTGRGKTTALLNLVNSLKEIGTVIVLDPSGSLAGPCRSILKGARYVSKTNPIKLNPLSRPYLSKSEHARELIQVINSAVSAFSENPEITVKMRRIMMKAIKEMDYGASMKQLGLFLDSFSEREKFFKEKYKGGYKPLFWHEFDMKGYQHDQTRMTAERISDRIGLFDEMEELDGFIKGKNEFDIPLLLEKNQHHIFNLARMDDEVTAIIGALVVNQVKSYYLHQAVEYNAKPLFFVIDEIALFIQDNLSRILTESRKFNIGFIMSFHGYSQINERLAQMVWANTYTKIYLGGNPDDEESFKNFYKYEIPDLKTHQGVVFIYLQGHLADMYPPPETEFIPECSFLRDKWIVV